MSANVCSSRFIRFLMLSTSSLSELAPRRSSFSEVVLVRPPLFLSLAGEKDDDGVAPLPLEFTELLPYVRGP